MTLQNLGWGYTLVDIDGLAKGAAKAVMIGGMPWDERCDVAFSAIAEHLYAAECPPSRQDLVQAGCAEIYAEVTDTRRHHGGPRSGGEWGSSPAFRRYWQGGGGDSFEDRLLDRVALGQVLAALPDHHRDALAARAAMDTADMAAALSVSPKLATKWVRNARAACLVLWFDDETPPERRGRQTMRRRRSAAVAPAPCGTYAAYAMHCYRREHPCDECREANRVKAADQRRAGE